MRQHTAITFLFFVILASTIGCKTDEPISIDPGYDYFPMDIGRYVSYDVDSIFIDFDASVNDTTYFQVKERIDSLFTDGEGRSAATLKRFYRDDETQPWDLRDVWTVTRTATRAEKYEENIRYVRMAFTVLADKQWDGNAFNAFDEWEYSYENIGGSANVGGELYSNTVDVIQRDNANLLRREFGKETYAHDIGMIYRELDTCNLFIDSQQIRLGVKMTMTAFDSGVE
jgi:hypothetical protein